MSCGLVEKVDKTTKQTWNISKYFCSHQGHILVDEAEDPLQFVELDAVVVGNIPGGGQRQVVFV